jgi:predicted nuclease of predicted toxin-antitoxin system
VTKRVLLDEGVPRHLANPLAAAGFPTTPYPNDWKQLKNGEVIALAEKHGFDVLVTNDKNIYAQQNLRGRTLGIIVLPTNLRRHVMERVDTIIDTIGRIRSGQYVVIEPSGRRPVVDYDDPGAEAVEMPTIAPFKFE